MEPVYTRSSNQIAITELGPTQEVQIVSPTTQRIAQLNDAFRKGDPSVPGQRIATAGGLHLLSQLDIPVEQLILRVAQFDDFAEHNDPHGEHDFGAFEFHGEQIFWKVDCYYHDYALGSDDPTDLSKTRRVLTIMLAHEW